MLQLESFGSFLSSKMSSWYLWISKKSLKAKDIKKNPNTYSFGNLIISETLKQPHTPSAVYSLEPNIHLPSRHPEKAYCQPSTVLETGFQRYLDTRTPLRSWP